jgi:HlyD family secretion protein
MSARPDSLLQRLRKSFRIALRPDADAMVLRQTHVWSRAILWTIIGTTVGVILWACLAPMDQVVRAQGKLEPRGSVREVQSPVGGVVAEVLVKEGETVEAGQILVRLDPKVAAAEARSLEDQLNSMQAEEQAYDRLFNKVAPSDVPESLPQEIRDLARSYIALVAEDGLLRAIIDASADGRNLDIDELKRFSTEKQDFFENVERIQGQLDQALLVEEKNRKIYEAYRKLENSGAGSRVDLLAREVAWIEAQARVENLKSQLKNVVTAFQKDAMTRLGDNTKRLADIVANLSKARLANTQRISETESRLEAAREALDYHNIKSPSGGIVFEILSSKPGAVVGAKDVILKIVPTGELIAKVDILNTEIGFISPGLACEVEVDTFPKREFGYIDGEVYFVGSDVLPPDEIKPFYSFPAKISLAKQHLFNRGKKIPLQSGMSVSVNIKIRKRLVINVFIDNLLGPVEGVRELR